MKDARRQDLLKFVEEVGLTPEEITESIKKCVDFLKEITAYGRIASLQDSLDYALNEARKLRSEAKPGEPVWLGPSAVDVEQRLLALIEDVKGVVDLQQEIYGEKLEQQAAYTAPKKAGWMERWIAVIASETCAENRIVKTKGRDKNCVGAEIFISLGYEIQGNLAESFRKLRRSARADMKKNPSEIKTEALRRMVDNLKTQITSKLSADNLWQSL